MVLSAHGIEISERVLRKNCQWDPFLGTSSTALVAAARALGFVNSREDYGLRLYDLRDLLRQGIFPIVGIQLPPYGLIGDHAQVVVEITSRYVEVYDPLLGPMRTLLATFEQAWELGDYLTIVIE